MAAYGLGSVDAVTVTEQKSRGGRVDREEIYRSYDIRLKDSFCLVELVGR